MKTLIKTVVLVAIATVVGSAVYVFFSDKEVLVFIDGSIKTVDQTWESGDSIFYEINSEIYLIDQYEIKTYGKRNLRHFFAGVKNNIIKNFGQIENQINKVLNKNRTPVESEVVNPAVLLTALLLLLFILFFHLLLKRNPNSTRNRKQPDCSQEVKDEIPTRIDIVRFFLNLYKLQLGAEPDALVEFAPLISKTSGLNHIYELRVKHMGDWVKRRMTIGPLGEESGSKSKCYYVIYDVHMVIKIPVKPIRDFEEYIKSIKSETEIVDKLAPKECIIPKVSVIIGLFQSFTGSDSYSPEQLEQKYIEWLRRNTEYQEYLKINNSFVYFMDLSKYYFLGHILEGLHDIKNSMAKEISENAQIIWDPAKFKGRYGIEDDAIFDVREVYNRCEADIRRLINKSGLTETVPLYHLQTWFFTHLAGKEVISDGRNIPQKFLLDLNRLLKRAMQDNSQQVYLYRKTIKEYLHRSSLEQNKVQMASITANLLDLLAWLREKRISMRDLKPDNLFVAGDPARYPLFLRSASEFSLGIIDVETAVDFEKCKYKKTKQPLLGGTPFYATPSHFIKNSVLIFKYRNLGKILHLQDWHAMMVMIYKAITGELLFEQTAKLFADIRNMLINSNKLDGCQSDMFEEASRIFWHSAVVEFQLKTGDAENVLKSVNVSLPETVLRMFTKVLSKERRSLEEVIKNYVDSQAIFEKTHIRKLLLKSTHSKVCQFKADLESKSQNFHDSSGPRTEAINFLQKLADLKFLYEHHAYTQKQLSQSEPKMTAYDVLVFMFNVVLNNMYRNEWKPLFSEAVSTSDPPVEETIIEATI
ncbi:MAG: hypothetical protein PVG70_15740 [Desulfobacterales bacterium]|jgi:serine/threonine protein kinase